jgi:hypothetical protein
MSHESSVKEWKERARAAEARVAAYENQIAIMSHMLEQRDAVIRQAEFDSLASQLPAAMPEIEDDEDDEAPDNVTFMPATAELIDNMFAFDVEFDGEGYKLEGVDAEGNVVDEGALVTSLTALPESEAARLADEFGVTLPTVEVTD